MAFDTLSFQLFVCFDLTSFVEYSRPTEITQEAEYLGKEIEWGMFSVMVNKLEISYLTFKWYIELKKFEFRWETIISKLNEFHMENLEEDSSCNGNAIFSSLILRMKLLSKAGSSFLSKLLCSICLMKSNILMPLNFANKV